MKRSTRIALSTLVVLMSPVIGLVSAIVVGRMLPGAPLASGVFEATPVNLLVPQLVFVMVTGLCALLGLLSRCCSPCFIAVNGAVAEPQPSREGWQTYTNPDWGKSPRETHGQLPTIDPFSRKSARRMKRCALVHWRRSTA